MKSNKYIIKIKDEKSGQKFKLAGNNFKISQNIDVHYVNFDSSGDFYCFDKRYVKYNLKLAVPKSMFIDIHKKMFDRKYGFSTLQYFHKELGIEGLKQT